MSPQPPHPLQPALDAAAARFEQKNAKSRAIHEEAKKYLPGGNSRTVLHNDPFPISIKAGNGYQVTSEDGDTYTDFTSEYSAALYGHSNPVIVSAITDVVNNVGLNLGSTTAQDQLFAKELCERFDLERVRFTNSGTEANMHALAGVRAFTKKRKVVVFNGGYHGAVLGFGSGAPAGNSIDMDDWIVAKYNDLESATKAIQSEGVAAVLVEGMQSSGLCTVATLEFMKGIQEVSAKLGVIFILDEVVTSRISAKGLAGHFGLKPDLKSFGKYLGGGPAFGAFGGREDIMAMFDPHYKHCLEHSGTFNNNTLVTYAGYAGLSKVFTTEIAEELTEAGDRFRGRLNQVTEGTKLCFTGLGSVMNIHFQGNGRRIITNVLDRQMVGELRDLFWYEMLEKGFWLARRGLIALIIGTPQSELNRFVECVQEFVIRHADYVKLNG